MSVHYTSPIWLLNLPPVAKIVLMKFGDNANDEGYAWPSLPRVARETGCGLSTVRRYVSKVRADGVLVLKRGGAGGRRGAEQDDEGKSRGATSRYLIDLDRARELYGEVGTVSGIGGTGAKVEVATGAQTKGRAPSNDGELRVANPPDAGGLAGADDKGRTRPLTHEPARSHANPPADARTRPLTSEPARCEHPSIEEPSSEEPSSEPSVEPSAEPSGGARTRHGDLFPNSSTKDSDDAGKQARRRGQRLTTDWRPGPEDWAFGLRLGFGDAELEWELDKFRDYWAGQSGQRGVKSDWPAAWRNWLRKAAEYGSGGGRTLAQRGGGGNRPAVASVVAAVNRLPD